MEAGKACMMALSCLLHLLGVLRAACTLRVVQQRNIGNFSSDRDAVVL